MIKEQLQKEYEELAATTTGDVQAIIPSEKFAKIIIEEAALGRRLKGVISASEEAVGKGEGDTVKVRILPKVSVAEVAEGASVADAAVFKPVASTVTLKRYAGAWPFTAQSIYHASIDLTAKLLSRIADAWAEKQDEVITQKLDIGAVSGTSYTPALKEELTTAGNFTDFYDKLKVLVNKMRHEKGLNPDYLVIPAEIYAQLQTDYEDAMKRKFIQVNDNGEISSVLGLKVIVTPHASAGNQLSQVVGVALDSKQALVEAVGIPAKFEEKREPEADVYKEVFNAYWHVEVIKADFDNDSVAEAIGIGQVVNPAV